MCLMREHQYKLQKTARTLNDVVGFSEFLVSFIEEIETRRKVSKQI
jgi:hypothetical protein